MTDRQVEDLYDFEDRFPWANHNNATLAQCRTIIHAACTAYGVKPPTVVQHGNSLSWCIPKRRKISLQGSGRGNKGGKNAATALHEAAHQIVYDLCGNRVQDHGPTFCGVYLSFADDGRLARSSYPRGCAGAWREVGRATPGVV